MPRPKKTTATTLAANLGGQDASHQVTDPAKQNKPASRPPAAKPSPQVAAATAHQPPGPDPLQSAPAPDGNAQIIAALMLAGKSLAEAQDMIAGSGTRQNLQTEVADATANARKVLSPQVQREINGDFEVPASELVGNVDNSEIVDFDVVTPRPGRNMLESLYDTLKEVQDMPHKRFRLSPVTLTSDLFYWLLYASIQEAQFRRNPNYGVENYLVQKLKENRAIDPSQGGKRVSQSSGPREAYDAKTGGWKS